MAFQKPWLSEEAKNQRRDGVILQFLVMAHYLLKMMIMTGESVVESSAEFL